MYRMTETLREALIRSVAMQFQNNQPQNSSYLYMQYMLLRGRDRFLAQAAVELANVDANHIVLCLGVQRCHALIDLCRKVGPGSGVVYAIERSRELAKHAVSPCTLFLMNEKLQLYAGHPQRIPLLNNVVDRVVHANDFHFWGDTFKTMQEIYRIMKPGGTMTCTLDLNWLKEMDRRGFLQFGDSDPLNYMLAADLIGFENVRLDYHTVDKSQYSWLHQWKHRYDPKKFQSIQFRKPSDVKSYENLTDEMVDQAEQKLIEEIDNEKKQDIALSLNPKMPRNTKYNKPLWNNDELL